jgi:ATP-dependent exoDNAse (exonuclease V) beta subunit
LLVQSEIPFLWPRQPETWVEGVIDLAVFTPAENAWRVVDWKTNQATAGIVQIYRGQIQAYVQALAGMLAQPAHGSLYLTSTGQWLPID